MKATFTHLAGSPIISEQEEGPIAIMKDIVFDPENGAIIGISPLLSKKIISVADIRDWTIEGIKVNDSSVVIPREDLIRLKHFSKDHTSIYAKPVYKKNGKLLGMVHDFVVDTQVGQLMSIYVAKKILVFTLEKRIIDYREIVEILEDRIIVKNDLAEKKESVRDFFELKDGMKIKTAM